MNDGEMQIPHFVREDRDSRHGGLKMERETGIEPVTSSLGSWRSTAELLPLSAHCVPANITSCSRRIRILESARLEQIHS